jgi:hypothetical protein
MTTNSYAGYLAAGNILKPAITLDAQGAAYDSQKQ